MQESQYPYRAVASGSCKYSGSNQYNVRIGNGGSYTPGTAPSDIMAYIATHGPAAAAIDASQLQLYESGVMSYPSNMCPQVDHAVLITGYDVNSNYYRVKNSWSAQWGESGYFRINTGSCGISSLVYGSQGL